MESSDQQAFQKLLDIIAALRDPQSGCPWDLKQTHESLKPYLIEEAYEALDAIDRDRTQLPSELGDVLLQVLLHSQIGKDNGTFSIQDVMRKLSEKLIERHPHVFSDTKVADAAEVAQNWNEIKERNKGSQHLLDDLSRSLPALFRADKIGQKVAHVGFDWDDLSGVIAKVKEELEEFIEALESSPEGSESQAEELGDLLFSIAQLARKLGFRPEIVLQQANDKFSKRFALMEDRSKKSLNELSSDKLEQLWQEVKKTTEHD